MNDIQSIAIMVETKTIEEVQEYMNVFQLRFRELKERDIVMQRIFQKNMDQRILETIRDFDITKDYTMLLQENNYFNKNSYLAMIERAHNKMHQQKGNSGSDLQLKIDHFFHTQTQNMIQEQLKYITIAIRAEDCLRSHLVFHNERKNMRKLIQRSKVFSQGYKEGISAKERALISEESKEELKAEKRNARKGSAVDENLKFGRRKKTANLFKPAE